MFLWTGCDIFIQPQYEFVYTALLEFIICGDTSIAGTETLQQRVTELSGIDHSVNKTGFQLQFEVTYVTLQSYPFINTILIRNWTVTVLKKVTFNTLLLIQTRKRTVNRNSYHVMLCWFQYMCYAWNLFLANSSRVILTDKGGYINACFINVRASIHTISVHLSFC